MRIAELVNHQIVERKLHFLIREVFLFECVLTSLAFFSLFSNKQVQSSFWGFYIYILILLYPNTLNQKRAIEMLVCTEIYGILSMLLYSFKWNGGSKIVLNGKCFISGCYSNIFEYMYFHMNVKLYPWIQHFLFFHNVFTRIYPYNFSYEIAIFPFQIMWNERKMKDWRGSLKWLQ